MNKKLLSIGSIATLLGLTAVFFTNSVNASKLISISNNGASLTSHECNSDQWQFIINQIDQQSDAPANITVSWGATSESVSLSSFTGGAGHYITTDNLNEQVTGATATIYDDWSGQFVLSDGPCDVPTPTPTGAPTATPTPTGVQPTVTPTPTIICDNEDKCDPTATPTPTGTVTVTDTPTPTPTTTSNGGGGNGGGDGLGCATHDCSTHSNPTQAVLGASTMATTGTFEENAMNLAAVAGIILMGLSVYGQKAKKALFN